MAGFLDRIRQGWVTKDTWPPPHVKEHWGEIEGYRRRYRNKKEELIQWNPNISGDEHKVEIYTPVPWPRELCRFSASLLFSEPPEVAYPGEKHKDSIDALLEVNDFGAFAVRGGVLVASEGRCGIRVLRDDQIDRDTPLLTLVPEDQIVWDVRHHGQFYAGGMVVITRKAEDDPEHKVTFRLLETHTAGLVERVLYKGDNGHLGKQVPLSAYPEFADLEPVEHTGLNKPTLIPWENVPGHESDLFGLGPLFDEINEGETLLLDRARKAIPRVFVDRSLSDDSGRLAIDGYIFTGGARMRLPLGDSPSSTIETVAPPFLAAEHIDWTDHMAQLMVTCAGYAPSTWGIQGKTASVERAVSGYAMKLAQLRTLLTRAPKEHMALQALGWAVATAVAWSQGEERVADFLPSIALGDGLPSDPLDGAQQVLYLRQAMAASTQTLVETINPTWTPERVAEEVDEIMREGAFPPGGGPATGLGPVSKRVHDILSVDDPAAGAGVDPGTRV